MTRLALKYNYVLTFICFCFRINFTLQNEWNLNDFLKKEHSLVKPYGSETIEIIQSIKNSYQHGFFFQSECGRHSQLGLCRQYNSEQ